MNFYFTADTHFGHDNIRKYCQRPFLTVEEMDETIINNWNKTVKPNDTIYHLGDFSFKGGSAWNYLKELNGKIKFIWGNHDSALEKYRRSNWNHYTRIDFLGHMNEIKISDQLIVLNHYAMRTWNKSHYGSWHLYGHSHGTLPDDPHSLSIDVGVDCHNYTPISFEQIKEKMSKKFFKPIDHHGERLPEGGIGLSKEEYTKAERKRLYEQLKREFNGN